MFEMGGRGDRSCNIKNYSVPAANAIEIRLHYGVPNAGLAAHGEEFCVIRPSRGEPSQELARPFCVSSAL